MHICLSHTVKNLLTTHQIKNLISEWSSPRTDWLCLNHFVQLECWYPCSYRGSRPSQQGVSVALQRRSHQIHPYGFPVPSRSRVRLLLALQLHYQETLAEMIHGLETVGRQLPQVKGRLLEVWVQQDVLSGRDINIKNIFILHIIFFCFQNTSICGYVWI